MNSRRFTPPQGLLLKTLGSLLRGKAPGQLVIQTTNHCNASCPQCGMRVSSGCARHFLPLDTIKGIIDRAAERGVQAISFTGGEPLLRFDDLLKMIRYAGKAKIPLIRTGTNGFLFAKAMRGGEAEKFRVSEMIAALADTPVRNFWISIDSCDAGAHEGMRGLEGVIRGIEWALPVFRRRQLFPSANLGITRAAGGARTEDLMWEDFGTEEEYIEVFYDRYRKAFSRFYAFVRDLGFTIANCCYPMSASGTAEGGLDAVYDAVAGDRIVSFSGTEKGALFRALADTIPHFRHELRIFSPLVSLLALVRQYSGIGGPKPFGCRGGKDFFFVAAAQASVFPCGYRGEEDLGKYDSLETADLSNGPDCVRCDWECFRDPSEMLGPFLQLLRDPAGLFWRGLQDPVFFKTLLRDLDYYRTCDYFDGRKAPDLVRLARYKKIGEASESFLSGRAYSATCVEEAFPEVGIV